jgi:hypothetical protein
MSSLGGSSIDGVLASAEVNLRHVQDPHQKLAILMAAAMEFNGELTGQGPGISSMMAADGLAGRLRKGIDKFTELLTDICRSLTGVISFSVGVSFTGLSIAVNFSTPQPASMSGTFLLPGA